MAKKGELPKRLATYDIPVCSACQYGKATRRPRRTKATNKDQNAPNKTATKPGQMVSVDMMVAGVPGLIAEISGFLTKQRYTIATIFVDHYSSFSYVHFQKSTSMKDTLEAKEAFV